MFFTFMRGVVRVVLFILNGRMRLVGKDRLPTDQNYVLVAPHRTWWEPLHLAVAASPKKFSFMAKKELFKNPILSFILKHANAFPVDREKPGPSAIKTPVKTLKDTKLSLVMFPSGSRHSADLKGGVAVIAKLAKVPIVPSVYQGPLTFKDLLKRKKVTVAFGEPIDISDIKKMDKEGIAEVERRMNESFAALDQEVDPSFKYEAK